jgi:hypothetical protein
LCRTPQKHAEDLKKKHLAEESALAEAAREEQQRLEQEQEAERTAALEPAIVELSDMASQPVLMGTESVQISAEAAAELTKECDFEEQREPDEARKIEPVITQSSISIQNTVQPPLRNNTFDVRFRAEARPSRRSPSNVCDFCCCSLNDFRELSGVNKAIVVVLFLGMMWLGIHTLVIFAEGNRDPSLPKSTPCPVLTGMPLQYQLEGIYGWNSRTIVKPAVAPDGKTIPLPPGVVIEVENRCFNGGIGSVFLRVNGQLAAFSRIDREIYDCHGEHIFDTDYDVTSDPSTLRIKSARGTLIWQSDVPDYGKDLIITGQPGNQPVATISSSSKVSVNSAFAQSAAADPRLIIMM